jgi:uncharacterized protein (TIGR02246 family)
MIVELEHLNERWNRAWLEKDDATVGTLMAADYVYVAPNGQVVDRATILGIIRSPSYQLVHGNRTEITVRLIGEGAAIVRHRWQGAGTYEGVSFEDDHRCTMICARRDGAWEIVLEHCTAIMT